MPETRILLIGDEPVLLLGVVRGLRRAGHEALDLIDPREARAWIDRAADDALQVLIADVDLREPENQAMLEAFRARFPHADMVVLGDDPIGNLRLRRLSKPVRINELLAAL